MASVEIDHYGAQENYYFHADYLGSVRMISDDNALMVWQKRYTPFGGDEEQSGTIENTYQFTGKGWDEDAQLFYFNARWYDADVGRFISEDPLWGNIRDPQSLNRFAYGRNNPYRYTDPSGMISVKAGVDTSRLKCSIASYFDTFDSATKSNSDQKEAVITSTYDSEKHQQGSRHYDDLAVDLRGNNVSDEEMKAIANAIEKELGNDYDVVPEFDKKDPNNDHIHIEYHPNDKSKLYDEINADPSLEAHGFSCDNSMGGDDGGSEGLDDDPELYY